MKKLMIAALAASALVPFIATGTAIARPMTEVDLATMNRLGSPTVSADGRYVAYQLTTTDLDANSRNTGLYLLDLKSPDAAPVRIADSADASEHSPAFAATGNWLFYLSGEGGSEQVWRWQVGSAAPQQVTWSKVDLAGFKLSPDGKKLAVWADVKKNCTLSGCPESEAPAEIKGSGREYEAMFVRHWDQWEVPGEYSALFSYVLDSDGLASGEATKLSGLVAGDTPTKPFGGGEEIAWFPDSSAIAFTQRRAGPDEPRSTNTDIYVAPLDQSQPTVNLTAANEATDTLPTPSPDGKYLAWAAMARPGYESDRLVLNLLEIATGKLTMLTQNWDRSVGSIAWEAGSKSLIVSAQDTLDHPLFRVDATSGKVTRLTQAGNAGDAIPLASGGIVYTLNNVTAPTDLVMIDKAGKTRRLTNVNAEKMADIDAVSYQRFSFAGANGDTVWGQIVKPASATGKLPLAFLVHGGPQGSFSNSWSSRWNPMVMASQGYATASVDFHGSTGYGQAFTDSINRDWGGKPLEDLQLGIAALPGIDAQIDTSNACALGASYGGYMMNWIQGNWPDAFKCIVNHDGVFDLRSMAYATEELWFDEWDHGGPWYARENPEKWNPVNHVTKWQTPMLVIHGEKDFRIPLSQSLAAFTALQRQNIPSKLLVFPDENHWVLKAKNSVQWHRNVFEWLDRWLKSEQ